MGRNDHHCPGRDGPVGSGPNGISAGGCRMTNDPVRHCEKHQNYCFPHKTSFMKIGQRCPSCVGEAKNKRKNNDGDDGDGGKGNKPKEGNKTKKRKIGKGGKKKAADVSPAGGSSQQTRGVRKNKKLVPPKCHFTRAFVRKLEAARSIEEARKLEEEEKRQWIAQLEEGKMFQMASRLETIARSEAEIEYLIQLEGATMQARDYFKHEHAQEQDAIKPEAPESAKLENPELVQDLVKIGQMVEPQKMDGLQEAAKAFGIAEPKSVVDMMN